MLDFPTLTSQHIRNKPPFPNEPTQSSRTERQLLLFSAHTGILGWQNTHASSRFQECSDLLRVHLKATASSRNGIRHYWRCLLDIVSQSTAFWAVSLMSAEINPLDPFNYKSTGELQLCPIQLEKLLVITFIQCFDL